MTRSLNKDYAEVREGQVFDVLIGIRPTEGPSVLQYVYPFGFAEPVPRYRAIGHGRDFGSILLKRLWKPEMTMEQVGELAYFIIKYIEKFELDNSVGVGSERPQIWFIPDKGGQPTEQSSPLLDKFEENSKKRLDKFASDINSLW
jgi:20S proteasome alpha/beta subunit